MIYQNYQVNQQIKKLEDEIAQIEQENQKLSDLISYFHTETYKQQEAREKLGLVLPGEKVLVFPDNGQKGSPGIIESVTKPQEESTESTTNYIKWWNFLFSEK